MVCGLSSQLSVPEQLFPVFFLPAVYPLFKSLSEHSQSVLAKRKGGQPLLQTKAPLCFQKLCSTLDFKERNTHFFKRNGWVNPVRRQPHGMASKLGSGNFWDRCRFCAHLWSVCCHCSELSLYGVYILKHVFGSLQRWDSSSAGYTCWPQALLSILKLFLSWKTGFPEFMCNL